MFALVNALEATLEIVYSFTCFWKFGFWPLLCRAAREGLPQLRFMAKYTNGREHCALLVRVEQESV